MLEVGPVLRTWALLEEPSAGQVQRAEELPDHRPAYLDYEGPLSGDRGSVTRWDEGTYEPFEPNEGQWIIDLRGKRLAGRVRLTRSADAQFWEFVS